MIWWIIFLFYFCPSCFSYPHDEVELDSNNLEAPDSGGSEYKRDMLSDLNSNLQNLQHPNYIYESVRHPGNSLNTYRDVRNNQRIKANRNYFPVKEYFEPALDTDTGEFYNQPRQKFDLDNSLYPENHEDDVKVQNGLSAGSNDHQLLNRASSDEGKQAELSLDEGDEVADEPLMPDKDDNFESKRQSLNFDGTMKSVTDDFFNLKLENNIKNMKHPFFDVEFKKPAESNFQQAHTAAPFQYVNTEQNADIKFDVGNNLEQVKKAEYLTSTYASSVFSSPISSGIGSLNSAPSTAHVNKLKKRNYDHHYHAHKPIDYSYDYTEDPYYDYDDDNEYDGGSYKNSREANGNNDWSNKNEKDAQINDESKSTAHIKKLKKRQGDYHHMHKPIDDSYDYTEDPYYDYDDDYGDMPNEKSNALFKNYREVNRNNDWSSKIKKDTQYNDESTVHVNKLKRRHHGYHQARVPKYLNTYYDDDYDYEDAPSDEEYDYGDMASKAKKDTEINEDPLGIYQENAPLKYDEDLRDIDDLNSNSENQVGNLGESLAHQPTNRKLFERNLGFSNFGNWLNEELSNINSPSDSFEQVKLTKRQHNADHLKSSINLKDRSLREKYNKNVLEAKYRAQAERKKKPYFSKDIHKTRIHKKPKYGRKNTGKIKTYQNENYPQNLAKTNTDKTKPYYSQDVAKIDLNQLVPNYSNVLAKTETNKTKPYFLKTLGKAKTIKKPKFSSLYWGKKDPKKWQKMKNEWRLQRLNKNKYFTKQNEIKREPQNEINSQNKRNVDDVSNNEISIEQPVAGEYVSNKVDSNVMRPIIRKLKEVSDENYLPGTIFSELVELTSVAPNGDLMDQANEILNQELLKAPKVDEKLARISEDYKTKETNVKDLRDQKETNIIERENERVLDKVHVISEQKDADTSVTTSFDEQLETKSFEDSFQKQNNPAVMYDNNPFFDSQYEVNKNLPYQNIQNSPYQNIQNLPYQNIQNSPYQNRASEDKQIGLPTYFVPQPNAENIFKNGELILITTGPPISVSKAYENYIGELGEVSNINDKDYSNYNEYYDFGALDGKIFTNTESKYYEYDDSSEKKNFDALVQSESKLPRYSHRNRLGKRKYMISQPYGFDSLRVNQKVKPFRKNKYDDQHFPPVYSENGIEESNFPQQSPEFSVERDFGISPKQIDSEYATEEFDSTGSGEFLKEERVAKESKTLLRNIDSYKNETSIIKGERKAQIKNNKESYHEAFLEKKDQHKYPSSFGRLLNAKQNALIETLSEVLKESKRDLNDDSSLPQSADIVKKSSGNQYSYAYGDSPANTYEEGDSDSETISNDYDYYDDRRNLFRRGVTDQSQSDANDNEDMAYANMLDNDSDANTEPASNVPSIENKASFLSNNNNKSSSFQRNLENNDLQSPLASVPNADAQKLAEGHKTSEAEQPAGNVVYIPLKTTTSHFNDFLQIREAWRNRRDYNNSHRQS